MPKRRNGLQVADLAVRYGASSSPVISSVNFELFDGEILALLGESGSGKSSIAKALLAGLPKSGLATGSIAIDGKPFDLANWSVGQSRPLFSYVSQEPWSVISEFLPIGAQLNLYIKEFATSELNDSQVSARAIELLKLVALPKAQNRLDDFSFEFSGGELQRISIALALAKSPRFLIADEPTASLDSHIKNEILQLFKNLATNEGLGILFISHDISSVAKIADRTISVGATAKRTSALKAVNGGASKNVKLVESVLEVQGLSVEFPISGNKHHVVEFISDFSISLPRGEILALVGPSGSGKTTVARAITGLVKCAGQIRFNFSGATELLNEKVRSRIGFVFQDSSLSLNPRMRVRNIILEPLLVHAQELREQEKDIKLNRVLKMLELPDSLLSKTGKQLSGGERQRVNLARALILEPKLIIADEPTASLNPELSESLFEQLVRLQKEFNFSMLFITHNLDLVRRYANKVAVIESGKLIEIGTVATVFKTPKSEYLSSALGN